MWNPDGSVAADLTLAGGKTPLGLRRGQMGNWLLPTPGGAAFRSRRVGGGSKSGEAVKRPGYVPIAGLLPASTNGLDLAPGSPGYPSQTRRLVVALDK